MAPQPSPQPSRGAVASARARVGRSALLIIAATAAGVSAAPRLLKEIEHEPCTRAGFSCVPEGGCELSGGKCVPKVGHYWRLPSTAESSKPAPAWRAFLPFVPPPSPPMLVMTENGLMEVTFNFFGASYKLHEAPKAGGSVLPGLAAVALCWVMPLVLWSAV